MEKLNKSKNYYRKIRHCVCLYGVHYEAEVIALMSFVFEKKKNLRSTNNEKVDFI